MAKQSVPNVSPLPAGPLSPAPADIEFLRELYAHLGVEMDENRLIGRARHLAEHRERCRALRAQGISVEDQLADDLAEIIASTSRRSESDVFSYSMRAAVARQKLVETEEGRRLEAFAKEIDRRVLRRLGPHLREV